MFGEGSAGIRPDRVGTIYVTVIRLKYVHRFKDRYGRVRHYLRKPGCKRVPLPEPTDKNFYREYERLLNGLPPEAVESQPIRTSVPGSLSDLICHWRTTYAYKSKEPSTQAVYNRLIKRIEQADYSRAAAATMAPATCATSCANFQTARQRPTVF